MKVRKTAFSGDTPAAGVVTERQRPPLPSPSPSQTTEGRQTPQDSSARGVPGAPERLELTSQGRSPGRLSLRSPPDVSRSSAAGPQERNSGCFNGDTRTWA